MILTELMELINCEGPILSIVTDENEFGIKQMYLKGNAGKFSSHFYAKTNDMILKMFFQDRLKVKELFLIRQDEEYIVKKFEDQKRTFSKATIDEELTQKLINAIGFKDSVFRHCSHSRNLKANIKKYWNLDCEYGLN